MIERRKEVEKQGFSVFLAPAMAALVGAVISGILSGAMTLFISSRTIERDRLEQQQNMEGRLSIIEHDARKHDSEDDSSRHELASIRVLVTTINTQLQDLRDYGIKNRTDGDAPPQKIR